jgi:hypothetical protein
MALKLKGPLTERRWTKSAENLGASLFNRDLSIYTNFSALIPLDSPFKYVFWQQLESGVYVY